MTPTDSRELYEGLVRAHAGDLYRFALRLCGEADLADDVVQEAFCQAWRGIESLRDPTCGRAWLFRILRRRFAHVLRDQSRRVSLATSYDPETHETADSGPDILEKLANQELLQKALNSLDVRYREPFLLVFQSDFSCREVAELLEVPLGTVLSRIHRARQQLRGLLRESGRDGEGMHTASPTLDSEVTHEQS